MCKPENSKQRKDKSALLLHLYVFYSKSDNEQFCSRIIKGLPITHVQRKDSLFDQLNNWSSLECFSAQDENPSSTQKESNTYNHIVENQAIVSFSHANNGNEFLTSLEN